MNDEYTPEERRLADRLAWLNNISAGDAPWTVEQGARWLIEHGIEFTDAAQDATVRAEAAEQAIREHSQTIMEAQREVIVEELAQAGLAGMATGWDACIAALKRIQGIDYGLGVTNPYRSRITPEPSTDGGR